MRTTRTLAIAAILGIVFSFRASANVVYDSETTNNWFSVDMSTLTPEALKSLPWTPPSADGEATVEDKVIKLDTDFGNPLKYTPTGSSEDVAIVAAEMTATVNAAEPELDSAPQAALCVIGTETATNWVGLVGTEEGYKWETFMTPVPVAGATYSVRIEFDQRQEEPRRIRYRIGDAVLGNGWYLNPQKTGAAKIASVSFAGAGDISGLGGSNVVANAATFNGVGYSTFADALVAARAQGSGWSAEKPVVLYKNAEHAATVSDVLYVNPNGRTFTINGEVVTKTSGFTYTITAKSECEAHIDSTYYVTFEEAVENAGADDVIVVNKALTKDLAIAKSLGVDPAGKLTCSTLTVGSGVTFNLAGNLSVQTATVNGSVTGEGILTVTGTLIGVNVAKLTFGDNATFAYGAAALAPTTLTLGNKLTVSGLGSVELGDTIISNVGDYDVSKFVSSETMPDGTELGVVGGQLKVVEAKPDIEIEIDDDTAGYDFTNGTINVSTTVKSGTSGTLTLTVVNFDGSVRAAVEKPVTDATKTVTFDLDNLTAGGTYSYMIEVSEDGKDKDLGTSYGTFTAANWGDDIWFGADATTGDAQTGTLTNGTWEGTAPTIDGGAYVIEEDSVFAVEDQSPGSNSVTRVDAQVTFESLVDVDSLEAEVGALGGFVAVSANDDTKWMALGETAEEWVVLTGAIKPIAGVSYVVRAEVDFLSESKRVRYLVSDDGGTNFYPLAKDTVQWLPLSASDKGSLAAVELKGSGKLVKIEAIVSDKAIAEVNGVKYGTMAAALEAAGTEGTNTIKLLTNATVEPDLKTPGKYAIAPNSHDYMSGGKVSSDAKTIIVEGTGKPPVVRVNDQEMQKVMTPGGKSYKNYDSLRKFLEKNGVEGYTKDNADAQSISAALEKTDTNNLQYWQDYALGIDVGTPVAPVTIPTGDIAKDKITLAIPAVDKSKYSDDYGIVYQVMKGTETTESENPSAIFIPLGDNATGTYTIKAVFTPKTEPGQAVPEN